ncbi:PH domain-containing protein [Nocardia cyriacigeorgica]|uniref:CFP-6 n=1 Tax=Nocardia cyriacigeorgica TaxID=135487 RepID=A0A4U8VYU5_9NOCA|nr:PH domain-containing protein [Nocardia cyriacigeorgica]MBF6325733.1 PH domain-containing protein [Nocardia cyriacigeorgica]VFA98890.1 CFP-6 [Nocardia cyriacigeorgica]
MSSPHQSVPPAKSSHTSDAAPDTGGQASEGTPARVIRITRLNFIGVLVLVLCVFFPFVGWPAALWWLFALPIAVSVWILRTQTTVSGDGLDLRTVLGSRHIDWAQVRGIRIPKRGYVRVHLDDDSEVKLPAVSYDRLRELVDASGGRIPDPFAGPAEPIESAEATTDGTTEPSSGADPTTGGDTPSPSEADTAAARDTDTTPGS